MSTKTIPATALSSEPLPLDVWAKAQLKLIWIAFAGLIAAVLAAIA